VRRWWLFVAVGIVIVAVTAGAGTWVLTHRNATTAVPPDKAVERFRAASTSQPVTTLLEEPTSTVPTPSTSSAPTGADITTTTESPVTTTAPVHATLPEPGVYVYDTDGLDSVDALNGAHHTYPAQTTITVTPDGCGVRQRWTAVEQRWEEWTSCVAAEGVAMSTFVDFHSFFNQGTNELYKCTGDPQPVAAPAGTTWAITCVEPGETTVWHGQVVGEEQLVIGGTPTPVEHVVIDLDDGDARDHQHREVWYVRGTDLVAKQSVTNDTTNSSPIGDVHYHERYDLTLVSLTPRR
jgi:hypothetical protein